MNRPAIIVLDDHPDSLIVLEEALRRRYVQDYLIVSETSVAAALGRLAELRASRRPVALVMAAMPIAPAGDAARGQILIALLIQHHSFSTAHGPTPRT